MHFDILASMKKVIAYMFGKYLEVDDERCNEDSSALNEIAEHVDIGCSHVDVAIGFGIGHFSRTILALATLVIVTARVISVVVRGIVVAVIMAMIVATVTVPVVTVLVQRQTHSGYKRVFFQFAVRNTDF